MADRKSNRTGSAGRQFGSPPLRRHFRPWVKTDRNDARGIAVVRTESFKPVHVKSIGSQRARTLAPARKHIVRSIAAAEQVIRGLLRPLGLKAGIVSRNLFATRVRELVGGDSMLEAFMNPLLAGREAPMRECAPIASSGSEGRAHDLACRLLIHAGIGPVSALTFRSIVDDPRRFLHSQSGGANLGLTPGDTNLARLIGWTDHKVGDGEARTALFEAATP